MSVRHRMRNWWNRWTYEVPLLIGDVLWDVLVVQFAAFLDRLTIRKVIEFVAIAVLVIAFVQTLPIDLAILFAGDTLMYFELLIAIRLAAGRDLIVTMLRLVVRAAYAAMRVVKSGAVLAIARIGRSRERRALTRTARPRRMSEDSDGDGRFGVAWGSFAMA
jgi:hypothetical protein